MHKLSNEERDQLYKFLSSVTKVDANNQLEVRLIAPNQPVRSHFYNNYNSAIDIISGADSTVNVYYGMASRKDNSSGAKTNCKILKCLFLDVDCGTEGHKKESLFQNKETALKHINTIAFPQPSIIVDSGNGLHLYWLLDEEIILEEETIEMVETIMKGMGVLFGSDTTHNVDRIFRMPYTTNNKSGEEKRCTIISANYGLKYQLNQLRSNELLNLQLDAIKNAKRTQHKYYSGIFGQLGSWTTDDRSSIDQSIICFLVVKGYTDEEIQLIFQNFPTTGKYKEHNSPDSYLTHSIKKARASKESNTKLKTNIADEKEYYKIEESGKQIGYYEKNPDGSYTRITNFIIKLNHRITRVRNENIESYYPGEAILEDIRYPFQKIDTMQLTDINPFRRFCHNLCGTKISIKSPTFAMNAIMHFNKDIPEFVESDFGYTGNLSSYITKDHIIYKDQFRETQTPIKYSEVWGNNSLGFKYLNNEDVNKLIENLINIYIPVHDSEVTLASLAFAFYPLVYPFLKEENPNKFYLMLCGTSGSGKSTIGRFLQNIYGSFQNLFSWTSTDTSITLVGSSMKDALFVIDDLKATNFKGGNAIKRAMGIIQNYSDVTSRNRSRVDLTLNEERLIAGHMLITGEDMIFTEASTLARGLVIDVQSKEMDYDHYSKLEKLSKSISGIAPYFIKTLLNDYSKESISEIFRECRGKIVEFNLTDLGISNDNYSRSINNAAALYTSWEIFQRILLKPVVGDKYQNHFPSILRNILLKNLKRINTNRQDQLFENLLWDAIQDNKLKIRWYNSDGYEMTDYGKFETVGSYVIGEKDRIDLVLSLDSALRELKRIAPELNITRETLEQKLISEKKIHVNSTGRHKIAGHSIRGVLWTGNIPKYIFGIEEYDPVMQTKEILDKAAAEKQDDDDPQEFRIIHTKAETLNTEYPDINMEDFEALDETEVDTRILQDITKEVPSLN